MRYDKENNVYILEPDEAKKLIKLFDQIEWICGILNEWMGITPSGKRTQS